MWHVRASDGRRIVTKFTFVNRKVTEIVKKSPTEFFKNLVIAFGTDNGAYIGRQLGVEKQTVYKWRDGRTKPTRKMMRKIAETTGKSPVWLMSNKSELSRSSELESQSGTNVPKKLASQLRLVDTAPASSTDALDTLQQLYSQLPSAEDQRAIDEVLAMVKREMEWRIKRAVKE